MSESASRQNLRQSAGVLLELAASDAGLPRHNENAAWALYYLAHELAKAEDTTGTEAAIRSAIEIRNNLPPRARWLDNYAWLLLTAPAQNLRDESKAESLASIAVQLAPKTSRFIHTLAMAQLRTGQFDESANSLRKSALLTGSGHPEQQLLQAILTFRQGDTDQARQLYASGAVLMEEKAPANPRLLTIHQEVAALVGSDTPLRKDVPDAPTEPTN